MRKRLSWLATGVLVAGLGGAPVAFSASTDTFIPIQDPPEMSMGTLTQVVDTGSGEVNQVTNRLIPTASSTVLREGFTGNADADAIAAGAAFDTANADDVITRLPASGGAYPYYTHEVTVTTNGPEDSIKRIGYCLINSDDSDVIADGPTAGFDHGDDASGIVENDVERNCGFDDDTPTSEGSPDSDSAALSFIYDPVNNSFNQVGDVDNAELVGTESSGSWDEASSSWTVTFAFKPSPALAKQSDGWIIRAAAQDKAHDVGEESFDPQMSQIFYGLTDHVEGELLQANVDAANFTEVAVSYFGAIVTEREAQDYGTLTKGASATAEGISTGTYLANAESEIYIDASDFASQAEGADDTLIYTTKAVGDTLEEGEVRFQCEFANTFSGPGVNVTNTPQVLESNLAASIDTAQNDTPQVILDGGMSCKLTYGGGAEDASESYENAVTLSIKDAGTAIAFSSPTAP